MGTRRRRIGWKHAAVPGGLFALTLVTPTVSGQSVSLNANRCCLNLSPHAHGVLTPAHKPGTNTPLELLADVPATAPGSFQIILNASPELLANPPALAAFQRAAGQWEARISDPITVTISAALGALGANVLGQTSATILAGEHNLVAEVLTLDAIDEGNDDAVIAALPSSLGFSQIAPPGTTNSGVILATKANFKAMGFVGLDQEFGAQDGSVTFSSNFNFDYDNRDGVDAGKVDFETVAAHEIGHLLGFLSIVDAVNEGFTDSAPFALDLLRFANNTANDPSTLPQWRLGSRLAAPGGDAIFDDLLNELPLATGLRGFGTIGGDGFQASHWKADDLTGILIGLMDPSLANGIAYGVQETDLRALDLIGYDIAPIPEPGAVALIGVVGVAMLRRRRCC